MNVLVLRKLFPAVVETLSYSCLPRSSRLTSLLPCASQTCRQSSNTVKDNTDSPLSENDVVNPLYTNRNPRNLERLGLAKKPKGWGLQYPPVSFYHRLRFEKTQRFVTGWVEHNSGRMVVTASTKEFAIAKHLYSQNDVSAAENVGRILGRRCLEAGINCMDVLEPETGENSDKYVAFRDALIEAGIELSEPAEVEPVYESGIDYDNEWELQNLKERQLKVLINPQDTVFKFGQKRRDKKKIKIPKFIK